MGHYPVSAPETCISGRIPDVRHPNGPATVVRCPSNKGLNPTSQACYETWRRLGNSCWVQYASGGHCNVEKSTSIGPDTNFAKIKLNQFKEPEYKVAFYISNWQNNYKWIYEENRWHGQAINDPRIPTSFVDGHAEYFRVWWKPTDSKPSGTSISRDGYY